MKVDKSKWGYDKLSNVVNILNGYAFKSDMYCKEGIRIIRITNVQDGYIEDNDPKYYPLSFCDEITKYILNENDLLISLTGNVGRVAFLPEYMLPAALNQRVACIRLKGNKVITLKYLYYYMMNKSFKDECIKSSKGVAQLNMSTEWLKSYILPIPPFHIQQSIASELDAIQTMIDGYKAQLDDLDDLAKSIFLDMFGDPVENPKGWDVKKLGELCSDITDGDHMPPPKSSTGIPFITISNINKNTKELDFDDTFFVSEEYYKNLKDNRKAKTGDLLYTVTGSYGIPVYVKTDMPFCFQRHIALIRTKQDVLSAKYLCYWTLCENVKKMVDKEATGVAQKTIGLNTMRNFKVIVPPLTLQQQFAAKIEAIESQKEKYKAQLADAEQLMAERMQYYFS